MSTTTSNLGLFKYDTIEDVNTPFSIDNALNNNWDIIDETVSGLGNNYVSKTGDTMTGALSLKVDNQWGQLLNITNKSIIANTAPSENKYAYISFKGANDLSIANVYIRRSTDNTNYLCASVYDQAGVNQQYHVFGYDSNGNYYNSFPACAKNKSVITTTGLSKAQQGYLKMGNGVIIQWGNATVTKNAWKQINFNTSFSSATSYSLAIAHYDEAQRESPMIVGTLTASSFKTHNGASDSGTIKCYWLAIGY